MSPWWLLLAGLVLWCWLAWRNVPEDPFDMDYPNSVPQAPDDLGCPDTQPTSPGALDSDHGRLR